jgi:hypothetical protein
MILPPKFPVLCKLGTSQLEIMFLAPVRIFNHLFTEVAQEMGTISQITYVLQL